MVRACLDGHVRGLDNAFTTSEHFLLVLHCKWAFRLLFAVTQLAALCCALLLLLLRALQLPVKSVLRTRCERC